MTKASQVTVHGPKHAAFPYQPGHCRHCDEFAETAPAYLEVTKTITYWVYVADRSMLGISGAPPYEVADAWELLDDWEDKKRLPHYHEEGDLEVEVLDDLPIWANPPVDADGPSRILWRASRQLTSAMSMLYRARYREGYCPEVSAIIGELRKIDDRLSQMAREVDDIREDGGSGVIHERTDAA